jgi:hypothetical protein
MKLNKKQTIALDYLEDNITEEVLFGGAAGPGKSLLGCYWQLKNRLKYPGSPRPDWSCDNEDPEGHNLKNVFECCKAARVKAWETLPANIFTRQRKSELHRIL